VTARIRFLDFVPNEDIPALYEAAFAVVVPSYFGPTNLQPIEAIALGRPVICSDLPGCREQMGDAALYCDLSDPASLADQLVALIHDQTLVCRLRKAGQRLAEDLAKMAYGKRLSQVVDDFAYVRRRWAWPRPPL
jgi:glycosyltransferase involved in cell wall biosynthesis